MIVLAVDTSSPQVSVALTKDGALLAEVNLKPKAQHSAVVLPVIGWILKTSETALGDVDLFACANGPGSFTGLRIGISTCLGLAAGSEKPVLGISTLEAAAWPFSFRTHPIGVVMDARKTQLYFQLFRGGGPNGVSPLGPAEAVTPERLADFIKEPTIIVGTGADTHRQAIASALGENALFAVSGMSYHRSHILALLAEKIYREKGAAEAVLPNYVRGSDVPTSGKTS